ERRGELDVEEDDDKIVIEFDPCGSGGGMQRGDLVEGTAPRAEEPYNLGVTREKHDWAWNEEGVCYYCAHCCFALERWPAEQWGHPVRRARGGAPAGGGPPGWGWSPRRSPRTRRAAPSRRSAAGRSTRAPRRS